MALPPNWTKYSTDDGKEYYYNSATNVTQWEKPEWSLGPESASFHSQSSEVYRPSVSDLDLQDRAAPTGGGMVPLGGHEARGGKLATTEADTVSLNVPSGAMDSVQGPAAGGSLRGFGGMIASAAGAEEGQDVQGWAGGRRAEHETLNLQFSWCLPGQSVGARISPGPKPIRRAVEFSRPGAMLSYAQQMFDVSSQDVLKRIKLALVPFQGQEDAANDFRTRPDFYGPFWVASTAILFLAATGNFARLLEMEDEQDFKSDYKLVSVAATLIYGLLVAVPLAVRLGLYCSGQSVDSINFKQANAFEKRREHLQRRADETTATILTTGSYYRTINPTPRRQAPGGGFFGLASFFTDGPPSSSRGAALALAFPFRLGLTIRRTFASLDSDAEVEKVVPLIGSLAFALRLASLRLVTLLPKLRRKSSIRVVPGGSPCLGLRCKM
ncbi:unnamed protein product [Effrenium voratum]|nr:unnamed protein product [Effrenium voratum]